MMHRKVVLRVVSKFLIPPILLFALYVQFHGDFGPGGGFQAGVIFAVAIMLYSLIFGLKAAMTAFPPVWARVGAAMGVAIYGLVGVICMLNGGRFLDYDYIFGPPSGEHVGHHNWPQITGIICVEVGVVVAVAAVMASSGEKVQRTIASSQALQGVTAVVIAHRLETVLGCDAILVMDAGEAVEYGAPAELAARPPRMAALPLGSTEHPTDRGYGLFAGMLLAARKRTNAGSL